MFSRNGHVVNALSKSKPGQDRETNAGQLHCPEETSTELDGPQTGTATAADAHRHQSRLGHRRHRRAHRHACIRSLLRNFEASLLGERLHCLDTIILNLRRGHSSRFGAKKAHRYCERRGEDAGLVCGHQHFRCGPRASFNQNSPTLTNVGKKRSSSVSPPTVNN